MTTRDLATSRRQCSVSAVTRSVPSASRATSVARAIAGPTADSHANASLANDIGWRWSASPSDRTTSSRAGIIENSTFYFYLLPSTFCLLPSAFYLLPSAFCLLPSTYNPPVYHRSFQPLPLVLASASPRRRELLARAGFEFEVTPADVDERQRDREFPKAYVSRLAFEKAETVAAGLSDGRLQVVLGADTIVVVDGDILSKPRDTQDAREMLRRLSGRSHDVLTGVALLRGPERRSAVEQTRVSLVELADDVIEWYLTTGEPMDKAGAYGVQGIASQFVERIEGSYTNVVGLPVSVVSRLLRDIAQERLPST